MKTVCTTEGFVAKAKKVHKNKYDYSLVEYKGSHSLVQIVCKNHGVFEQLAYKHLDKRGCAKCYDERRGKTCKKGLEKFIKESTLIHDEKYNYSKVEYDNSRTKVIIICKKHGEFYQTPKSHLDGQGCSKCGIINKSLTKDEFIFRANKIHQNKFTYLKTMYTNNHSNTVITCSHHGDFLQRPLTHLAGFGCSKCSESLGEKEIRYFLNQLRVPFRSQYRFNDCRNKKSLPFDFSIIGANNNIIGLIEYHGVQHFDPTNFYAQNGNFEKIQLTDAIKNKYCNEHKIPLLVISYRQKTEIANLLNSFIRKVGAIQ